ncbi:MAG: hypothetical protein NTV39_02530 [Candidatus Saccharibacteria bacterium]|nr:hypothetical protein [Candidatus Saccharibacteria bacterium]
MSIILPNLIAKGGYKATHAFEFESSDGSLGRTFVKDKEAGEDYMTVPQEGVVTLDDIVAEVQHLQNNGGAEGLYDVINVNVATCRWQKPAKGSKMRTLIMAFKGRGNTKHTWCVNESDIGHKVRDGRAHLTSEGMPSVMLLLPAFA